MSKPAPERTIISFELPGKLLQDLMKESSLSHTSRSDVIRNALYEYLEKQNQLRVFFSRFPNKQSYEDYSAKREDD